MKKKGKFCLKDDLMMIFKTDFFIKKYEEWVLLNKVL